MAEDNSIFSKRKNQLGSLINKNHPQANDENIESKTYLETEDIINDIVSGEMDSSISEDIPTYNTEDQNVFIEDEPSTQQKSMLDEIMNNNPSFDDVNNNYNEDVYNQPSFEEPSTSFDIDENNPFMNDDAPSIDISDFSSDDEIEDIIEDANDEIQISIEDDSDSQITYEEESSLMDDMLSSLDDELQNQQEMIRQQMYQNYQLQHMYYRNPYYWY